MQTANIVHVVFALLFICMAVGHIYIGTIGMEGALDAMRTGYVDETWAKEHHELWFDEQKHAEPGAGQASTAPAAQT